MQVVAFENAVARQVIASALILGLVLLAFGCGDGDDRSAQAVKWEVSRRVGLRKIKLVTEVDYCGGISGPIIERPVIEYSGKKVFIELRLAPQEDSTGGCLLQHLGIEKAVTLKRDVDELVLLDSSTTPPERRWPR